MISIIVAHADNGVIGRGNELPWHMPADMKHFRDITTGSTIIMGRNTYESIAARAHGPLPNRRNIIVSGSIKGAPAGFELAHSLESAIKMCDGLNENNEIFLIGGEQLYRSALEDDLVDHMYITEIHASIEGDAWFPAYDKAAWLEVSRKDHEKDDKNPYDYTYVLYLRGPQ